MDPCDRRILDCIADDGLQVCISIDDLVVDGDAVHLMTVPMGDRYVTGRSPDIVMHEAVTFVEGPVQYEVNVVIHQRKGQDDDMIRFQCHINAVHAADEVGIIVENGIHILAVSREMPAIPDWNLLSFNECDVQSEI